MNLESLNSQQHKAVCHGEGPVMVLAGAGSGPPPKSGPTPHGLPYIAKNVRPIKERK